MSSRSSNRFIPKEFPDKFCVGFIKSAHGLRGEVYIQLTAKRADWLPDLKNIYFLLFGEGELKAFTVEFAKPHKDGLRIKVAGISDRNQSELLRKSSVYIDEGLLEADEGEAIFLKQILGFDLVDPGGQQLGRITGFSSNGAQDLLEVTRVAGEALVPFVEAFLKNIDYDKREVRMDLPPGLLDIE